MKANEIRCGSGVTNDSRRNLAGSLQIPYLTATVSAIAGVSPERLGADKVIELHVSLSASKLNESTPWADPGFNDPRSDRRTYFFQERGAVFLPLLIAVINRTAWVSQAKAFAALGICLVAASIECATSDGPIGAVMSNGP